MLDGGYLSFSCREQRLIFNVYRRNSCSVAGGEADGADRTRTRTGIGIGSMSVAGHIVPAYKRITEFLRVAQVPFTFFLTLFITSKAMRYYGRPFLPTRNKEFVFSGGYSGKPSPLRIETSVVTIHRRSRAVCRLAFSESRWAP